MDGLEAKWKGHNDDFTFYLNLKCPNYHETNALSNIKTNLLN